jgi:hypothetical protein
MDLDKWEARVSPSRTWVDTIRLCLAQREQVMELCGREWQKGHLRKLVFPLKALSFSAAAENGVSFRS